MGLKTRDLPQRAGSHNRNGLRIARLLLLAALLLACSSALASEPGASEESESASESATFDHRHSHFEQVLRQIVDGQGQVAYGQLKGELRQPLDRYISGLESVSADDWEGFTDAQRRAFWINAYNAYTLMLMAEHPDASSIRTINERDEDWAFSRPLARLRHLTDLSQIDGPLSLNDIEHRIYRPTWPDARIHFVLVCAAKSCPPLRARAWTAPSLDDDMEATTRSVLRDESFVRVEGESVAVTRLLDWFSEDFERDAGSVRDYLLRYVTSTARAALEGGAEITFMEYDWSLNGTR